MSDFFLYLSIEKLATIIAKQLHHEGEIMTLLEQILITTITACATAILAYFGFWRQAKADLQKMYESRFNEKKWEVFINFMELIPLIRQVSEDKLNQKEAKSDSRDFYWSQHDLVTNEEYLLQHMNWLTNEEHLHDELQSIEERLLLIASSDTVKKFLIWRNYSEVNPVFEDEKGTIIFIDLINTMREDLGNIKSKLNPSDFDGIYFVSEKKIKENRRWVESQVSPRQKSDFVEVEKIIQRFYEECGNNMTPKKLRELDECVKEYLANKKE